MDLHHDDENFARIASTRKVNIIADRPINLKFLQMCRHNVYSVNLELNDSFSAEYVEALKKLGLQVYLGVYENDDEKLNRIRYQYFDYEVEQLLKVSEKHLDFRDKITDNTMYRTNKFILSKGNIFMSRTDWKKNDPIPNFGANIKPIGRELDFWEEKDYFKVFND